MSAFEHMFLERRNTSKEQMVHNQTSSINSANLMPLTNTTNYVPLSTWISSHSCLGFRLCGQEYLGRNQLRGLVCRARRISLRGLDLIHPGSSGNDTVIT